MSANPFALPDDSREITIDLPLPVSSNRLWRSARGHVYRSKAYLTWIKNADAVVTIQKAHFQRQTARLIDSWFTIDIALHGRASDGDNRIKAVLDYLQRIEVIKDDKFCVGGSWHWVPEANAPRGCRVTIRSWHGEPPR